MYTIRVDAVLGLLRIELSGRVATDEALRAVSQAYTLADAGGISAVACDLAEIRRGPGGLLLVAAALAAGYRPGMRIALVGGEAQNRLASRVARFSGLRDGVAVFETQGSARAWLAPALRDALLTSPTGRRHAEGVKTPRRRLAMPRAADPAA